MRRTASILLVVCSLGSLRPLHAQQEGTVRTETVGAVQEGRAARSEAAGAVRTEAGTAMKEKSPLRTDVATAVKEVSPLRTDAATAVKEEGLLRTDAGTAVKEVSPLRTDAATAMQEFLFMPPARLTTDWLKEEVDPIRREKRLIRERMEQRARQSVVHAPAAPASDEAMKAVGLWRWSVGNTGTDNWSPFPDRALDARIIRFPLPRDMQPDKRPAPMGGVKK